LDIKGYAMKKTAYVGRHYCPFVTNVLTHVLLQHRPIEHLKERPDLIEILQKHISDMESWAHRVCSHNFVIDQDEMRGNFINVHFESVDDAILFANQWGHAEQTTVEEYELPKYSVKWSK
jgi:hypothetical protein